MSIYGFCPMGCGETLFVDDGHIKCLSLNCPRDTAVDEILSDPEIGHIINLGEHDFNSIHPLWERLDRQLLDCPLNQYLRGLGGPPVEPGIWRVTASTARGTWAWEQIS